MIHSLPQSIQRQDLLFYKQKAFVIILESLRDPGSQREQIPVFIKWWTQVILGIPYSKHN